MTTSSSMNLPAVLTYGALRSLSINVVSYPLENIKTNQQVQQTPSTVYSMAMKMFRSGGWTSFYQGFKPHLAQGVVKQTAWWPAIAYVPPILKKYKFSSLQENIITGCSVAALEALVNSPLEKLRVRTSTGQSNSLLTRTILQEGWTGFTPYLRRQSIRWSVFFIGLDYFKKNCTDNTRKTVILTPSQIASTSFKLSLIGSIVFTPFDMKNTISQSNRDFTRLKLTNLRVLYRGFPLNLLTMFVQTSATVFLMNYIDNKRKES